MRIARIEAIRLFPKAVKEARRIACPISMGHYQRSLV